MARGNSDDVRIAVISDVHLDRSVAPASTEIDFSGEGSRIYLRQCALLETNIARERMC